MARAVDAQRRVGHGYRPVRVSGADVPSWRRVLIEVRCG
jgi:hypothetical protein